MPPPCLSAKCPYTQQLFYQTFMLPRQQYLINNQRYYPQALSPIDAHCDFVLRIGQFNLLLPVNSDVPNSPANKSTSCQSTAPYQLAPRQPY